MGRKDCSNIDKKLKLRSFKSSEHINEEGGGPYRGFDYSRLVSDPIDLATWSQRELLLILISFNWKTPFIFSTNAVLSFCLPFINGGSMSERHQCQLQVIFVSDTNLQ